MGSTSSQSSSMMMQICIENLEIFRDFLGNMCFPIPLHGLMLLREMLVRFWLPQLCVTGSLLQYVFSRALAISFISVGCSDSALTYHPRVQGEKNYLSLFRAGNYNKNMIISTYFQIVLIKI